MRTLAGDFEHPRIFPDRLLLGDIPFEDTEARCCRRNAQSLLAFLLGRQRAIALRNRIRHAGCVTDRRYGAIPGSAYWRHLMIGA